MRIVFEFMGSYANGKLPPLHGGIEGSTPSDSTMSIGVKDSQSKNEVQMMNGCRVVIVIASTIITSKHTLHGVGRISKKLN